MLPNVALRRIPPALGLLLWCALGTALVQLVLARLAPGNPPANPHHFSQIFWYLLSAYDTHGNLLLLALMLCAFLLRRQPAVAGLIRFAADHPWQLATAALPLLCFGALTVYRDYPLSMDEYVAVFQAQAFAAGRFGGQFPPELLDQLLPRFPPNYFFTASRATGEVSGSYWPGFALLVAPFAGLGIPWAANPVISALTLPAVHRLTHAISGSREAAGWAVALTLASPVFVVSALSYYSMPAHLLCSLLYALLLLRPTVMRALLAGLVGSVALVLHNPVPHLLFSIAFVIWLLLRRESVAVFGALLLGYLPLVGLLGFGWQHHLAGLVAATGAAQATTAATTAALPLLERLVEQIGALITFPRPVILEARIAGLSKIWTWSAAGLGVLAVYGYTAASARAEARLLATAFAITFFAYYFVPFDQGHGWGYRYIHSAWFVLPVLAALGLGQAGSAESAELRNMVGWGVALSLVFANALRLVQVDGFMARHLAQVPPLARSADPGQAEIVFVVPTGGFYTQDMVHNDPFLRDARITMVYDGRDKTAILMAQRFPGYVRRAEGQWGELWTAPRDRR
jgi:hypothetical protein